MTRRAAPLLLAALVLLAAACGDEPAGPAGPSDGETPWGRTFLAVSVTEDGAERPLADGTTIRLDFDDEAGQLGAHAGCNHMGADLELDGDRLRVGSAGCNRISGRAAVSDGSIELDELHTTDMACEGEAMQLEEAVLAVIARGTVAFEIEASSLILRRPSGPGLGLRAAGDA